jgi:hypothetical protein
MPLKPLLYYYIPLKSTLPRTLAYSSAEKAGARGYDRKDDML